METVCTITGIVFLGAVALHLLVSAIDKARFATNGYWKLVKENRRLRDKLQEDKDK